jgi:hypothetical protein
MYESVYEATLDNLQKDRKIYQWWPAEDSFRSQGIHYWIVIQQDTELVSIPFGIAPNRRMAQEKRKKHDLVQDTTINLIGQGKHHIKSPHILERQTLKSIKKYLENMEASAQQ